MFVMTMKWNKKTALLIVIAAALLLCALVLIIGAGSRGGGASPSQTVKTNEERIMFLNNLGWEVEPTPLEEKTVIIPREFSDVYENYNALQLEQGYDLSGFCGLEVTIYTYTVTNYASFKGTVVADLYIYQGRVIGGDIHTLAIDGFMHGLRRR